MGEIKKLNLNAILKNKNNKAAKETETIVKESPTQAKEETKNTSWTLNKKNLSINKDSILNNDKNIEVQKDTPTIKNTKKEEKKEETPDKDTNIDVKKTPIVKTKEKNTHENTKEKEEIKEEKNDEDTENHKRVKFNQDALLKAKEEDKKKLLEKQEKTTEKKDKNKDKDKEKKEDHKEIFSNYKTDYKKEKVSIVQKIKKLKNLPKTNYKLVIWLIVITLWIVATLFYLNPEDFSLQNIKASMFNILHEDEIDEKRNEIENEYNQLVEEQKWKKDTIKYSWFDFTIEFRSLDWVKEYKYKNIEYITLEEIYKVLDEEIKLKQKDIIKDALLERFK